MKAVLHRLEQISSGSLNTAVRTGVGFSLSRSFCAVQTPSKTPYASMPICWGTPWWGELKWLLQIARELLTLTGYSVTVWYSWTCQAAVWFSTSWLFHLALNWSGRVSPTPPSATVASTGKKRDDRRWCVNGRQLQPADGRGLGARFRHHTRDGFAAGTKQHSAEQDQAGVQTRARM